MTAPDSRYLDEAMTRLAEAVAQPVGGSIVISTADACAIGNELRRLQALARGPQQAGGEDAEDARHMYRSYVAAQERAETAEAALREAGRDAERFGVVIRSPDFQWNGRRWPMLDHDELRAAIDAALNEGQDDG